MLSRAVDAIAEAVRPYRRQASCWVMGGTILAGGSALLAAARIGYLAAIPYLLVAAATATLTVGCRRSWRWALAITVTALGAQVLDVIGASWAVAVNPRGAKADDLQQLGIVPRIAFAVNLAYSSLAVVLFAVLVVRARTCRHKP